MKSTFFKYKWHIALLVTFLPYVIISFYAQPIAEDFGFAAKAQTNNFFDLLFSSYQKMNGRYMANIFMFLSPLTFKSFFGYQLTPFLLILLLNIASYHAVKNIFPNFERSKAILLGLGLSAVYLNGLPIISEGLYWYTGSSIYFIGIIFLLFTIGQLARTLHTQQWSIVSFLWLAVLLIISIGFNETQTALIVIFFFTLMLAQIKQNNPNTKPVMGLFLIIITFSCVMVFAPGNQMRAGMYTENTQNIVRSGAYTIAQVSRFSLLWLLSIPLLAASIYFVYHIQHLKKHSTIIAHGCYINKWLAFVLVLSSIAISVFPAYWFTGILGQHRTLNTGYFFFILSWFVCLCAWFRNTHFSVNQKTALKITRIALVVGLIATNNGFHAIKDLVSGDALTFHNQLKERQDLLSKTSNTMGIKIQFEPLKAKPKTLFVSDISEDPNYWMNLGYNDYYLLDQVPIYLYPN